MFFLIAMVATLGYSVQGTLLASYYRRMDRLSVVSYRGLALGLTMLPLLLVARPVEPPIALQVFPALLAAALVATMGNWCGARAYSFLPVGVASALSMSVAAVVALVLGFIVLDESLRPAQLAFIGLTLVGIVLLGAARSTGPLPSEYDTRKGILNSLLFGGLVGIAYTLLGSASRQLDPFVVGYSYEFLGGLVAGAIALVRGMLGGSSLRIISWRDFATILAITSPTILGTGGLVLALSLGPVAIVTAIVSTMMVFKALLALVLYQERPTRQQWCLLVFVCAMVVGLKLSS